MADFSVGIILDSFRRPIPEAVRLAADLGADGVQVYATRGEMSPEELTGEKRAEFRRIIRDNGLVISALCGDLGHGFMDPDMNPSLVEKSKRILDLAVELETKIVTTHIGIVPSDPAVSRYKIMQDACGELAAYADSLGAHFAVETGPESPETLKVFLDSLHSTGVAVNYDPANLAMVMGCDVVKGVRTLKDYIVHTHAKDGVRLLERDPEITYGLRKGEEVVTSPAFEEVPLGEGSVPFTEYLNALREIGYHGFLTIEREVGEDPVGDISRAVRFLKDHI